VSRARFPAGWTPGRSASLERKRLTPALLLSLLIHALLLSLVIGGSGQGLPGFGFPWQDRRVEASQLRVVLQPAQAEAVHASQNAEVEPAGSVAPAPMPSPPVVPTPTQTAAEAAPESSPKTVEVTEAAPAATLLQADSRVDALPPPIPEPALMSTARPDATNWTVPAPPPVPAPAVTVAPSASSPAALAPPLREADDAARERAAEAARVERAEQEARRQAEQLEAVRREAARQQAAQAEAARLESQRQEAARQEAARQELAHQEAARIDAERREAARQLAARQEAVRQEAARQEAARQEAARQDAARQEAARQEAARQEAARQEAARQDAARQEAARQDAARQAAAATDPAQEAAARREAALRAIGRQLDEEAARREAASTAARQQQSTLPYSWSSARRGRLFGHSDANEELVLYAEAWARKIQLNMTFEMVREAAKQPHTDPVVTVAIRSDGSVESVTFVRSSGVPAIDEAIRNIVRSQEHYPVFPPALARDYDVIEIRRTWYFDMAVRLY
jgi:TolA protein